MRHASGLRWVENVLWLIAVAGLGTFLFAYGEGWLWQSYLNYKFEQSLAAENARLSAPYVLQESSYGFGPARAALSPYIGRLDIPRLQMSVILLEGDDSSTLLRGIGHIPGTAYPGKSGNIGVAGHRDTFFRGLAGIRKADRITVTTVESQFEYSVDSMQIVKPQDVEVLADDNGRQVLTLVTCYPFGFIGSAPLRFVVHASRTE